MHGPAWEVDQSLLPQVWNVVEGPSPSQGGSFPLVTLFGASSKSRLPVCHKQPFPTQGGEGFMGGGVTQPQAERGPLVLPFDVEVYELLGLLCSC
jgi:hypothetical protein